MSSSHSRINSTDERRRVAIPRRSTKGPLDAVDDDPLAALSQNAPPPPPPPSSSQQQQHHHQQQGQAVRSPTTHHAPASITSSLPLSTPASPPPPLLQKDFSFLQSPSTYHVLPATNIPPPFLSAPHTPSVSSPIDTLLLSGHYRLAAIAAARNLITSPSTDHTTLFHLLHIRLACLCLVNEHSLAAQEAKVFGDLGSSFYYANESEGAAGGHLVPWGLRVLVVRLSALGYGEWRKGVMGYFELARECRGAILGATTDEGRALWRGRLRDVGVRVANVMVEMGDLEGAGRHLEAMRGGGRDGDGNGNGNGDGDADAEVVLMETLTWLRLGDVQAARRCLAAVTSGNEDDDDDDDDDDADHPNALLSASLEALILLADAQYDAAANAFTSLRAKHPTDAMLTQNLAVCLLYTGRIAEAKALLEEQVDGPPFHSLIFNLCTVYELCTERNRDAKMGVASKLASRRGEGNVGWEMRDVDFKL